jgi:hypothetical protein
MAFKPEKFTYQPLQEPMDFRLLELLPSERDETLKCSLTHSSLTSHPYYHAVSYTWGTPGLFQEIELGGVGHSIQTNLFDFLQQLRLTHAAVTLWVDAGAHILAVVLEIKRGLLLQIVINVVPAFPHRDGH